MKKFSPGVAIFLILIPTVITDITNIKDWSSNINSDGFGYYAYLPCVFIYHHFDYAKVMEEELKFRPNLSKEELKYPFVQYGNDKLMDKYYVGVAVLLTPFFLLAYFLSFLFGQDLNGYSAIFQEGVAFGALFYLIIGLIFLRKLMKEYGIPEKIIYFTIALILYGTNLFYYTTNCPSISHVYSFGLMAMFLYFIKRSIQHPQGKTLLVASILLGLLFIVRPTNILAVIIILFLAGDFRTFKMYLLNLININKIAILLIGILSVLCIQFLKWHAEIGQWYIWGYRGEGFNFSTPHFFDILFSYRKGWFVYTPLVFFILVFSCLTYIYQNKYYQLVSVLLFFFITVYVCSSWYAWWYGGSFGMRVFIDYYPFYALLFGIVIMEVKNIFVKITVIVLPVLCLIICIIQTIQYNKFILACDKMNKKRYWEVFLKTDDKYGWIYENPSSKLQLFENTQYHSDLKNYPGLKGVLYNNYPSIEVNSLSGLIPVCLMKTPLIPSDTGVWIYIALAGYTKNLDNDAFLVTQVKDPNGNIIVAETRKLSDEMAGRDEWEKMQFIDTLSAIITPGDSIKIYARCTKGSMDIADINVQFGVKK